MATDSWHAPLEWIRTRAANIDVPYIGYITSHPEVQGVVSKGLTHTSLLHCRLLLLPCAERISQARREYQRSSAEHVRADALL